MTQKREDYDHHAFFDEFRCGVVGRHANERVANTTEIAGNSARERQRSKIKDDTREENEKREERKLTTDSGGYTHPRIYNPLRYDNKRMFSYIEIYLRILPTFLFLFVKTFIKEKKLIDIKISFFLFIRSILSALSLYSTNFFRTFSRETRVIDRRTTSLISSTPSRSGDKIFPSFF